SSESGASCSNSTRRPLVALVRPARTIDGMISAPERATRTVITPFAKITPADERETDTARAGAAGWPGTSVYVLDVSAAPTACPLHLTDPSGQKASGQDCTGAAPPSARVRANRVPRATVPRGHG